MRIAFLFCAFGPPFCGAVMWLLTRLTIGHPLTGEDWQFMTIYMGVCSILCGLIYGGLYWKESA